MNLMPGCGRGMKTKRTSVLGLATEEGRSSVEALVDERVGGRDLRHKGRDTEPVGKVLESHVRRVRGGTVGVVVVGAERMTSTNGEEKKC
jgi:hypothetical protein